jgi:hypothetical protein
LTTADFEGSMLALFCWRRSRVSGLDAMVATANTVRNLSRRDGLSICEAITQYDQVNFSEPVESEEYPDVRDPMLVNLMRHIEQIYYGRAEDITNGAIYSVNLTAQVDPRFREEILDKPDEHPMCAIVGRKHFFK